ncbi:hypothetical protein CBLAS_0302 [Campylobacter blaseri]|uniref:Uncharacterized protein n=1 Tax=Campylobacter blaseri TaxID=2042961 RepID=A0A2P8R1C4_9BACT|nr:hypothetical protein [Campylobacter blaseri]PSM52303.1 hypothetical protein CQ405_04420 [Campylobacter blaseri]PSM54069.1 hypothetical protein CRN67_04420 [Campylobacter blaseri]QKF85510.1 hypothetical protein CBLAS_0302 [Campylobacter blaseri]
MRLFGNSPKMFYSVCVDNNVFEIFFREFDKKNTLKQEFNEKDILVNKEHVEKINFFLKSTGSKKSFLSFMHTSLNQGLVDDAIYNDKDFIMQEIDKDVISYSLKSEIEDIKNLYNVEYIEYINPFKVLYFLMKNENFKGTSLFILKFSQSAAVMVANSEKVIFSKMINFIDEGFDAFKKDPDSFSLEDDDEIFVSILQNFLNKFYETNSSFVDEIFVYDTCSSNRELGYYIFTKLFIKTNVFPLDIVEYINKINIKEHF